MLTYSDGEIIISPKQVHWFYMPASVGEEEMINFLKIDFLIISENKKIDEIEEILKNKNDKSVYIFNLDKLFFINGIQENKYIETVQKIANYITINNVRKVTIVHTTIIDPKIESIFKKIEVVYIEKTYEGRIVTIMEDFPTLINNLLSDGKQNRAFIRINLYPKIFYKAQIVKCVDRDGKSTQGLLKDISMNGIALVFQTKEDIEQFNLKDEVKVQLHFYGALVKIDVAIITRKDGEKFELAMNYDLKNEKMISEKSASFLMTMIYKWLKDVIDKKYIPD